MCLQITKVENKKCILKGSFSFCYLQRQAFEMQLLYKESIGVLLIQMESIFRLVDARLSLGYSVSLCLVFISLRFCSPPSKISKHYFTFLSFNLSSSITLLKCILTWLITNLLTKPFYI